jgi:hypothetical protein
MINVLPFPSSNQSRDPRRTIKRIKFLKKPYIELVRSSKPLKAFYLVLALSLKNTCWLMNFFPQEALTDQCFIAYKSKEDNWS